jgi:hypothetical protein
VDSQYQGLSIFEFTIFKFIVTMILAYIVYVTGKSLKNIRSFRDTYPFLQNFVLLQIYYRYIAIPAYFTLVHFQQDILFNVGGIFHHSSLVSFTDKSNLAVVETIPQGCLLHLLLNIIWFYNMFYYILKNTLPSHNSVNQHDVFIPLSIGMLLLTFFMKYDHELYHSLATEEFKHSLPFTFEYRAYKHAFCHHSTGGSFAMHPLFDSIFEFAFRLYTFIHHGLFLRLNSLPEKAIAVVFDVILSILCMFVIVGYYHAFQSIRNNIGIVQSKVKKFFCK